MRGRELSTTVLSFLVSANAAAVIHLGCKQHLKRNKQDMGHLKCKVLGGDYKLKMCSI